LQGASAIEKVLDSQPSPKIRVFVVWEPVLPTDLSAPSTATLKRLRDHRVSQYWDKGRVVSRLLGERDHRSIVWDYVAVYPPGALWKEAPPEPLYAHTPVVKSIDGTKEAIRQAFQRLTDAFFPMYLPGAWPSEAAPLAGG
jgi:hypothetical protein